MGEYTKTAFSLGGNLGDVVSTFDKAILKLEDEGLCEIRRSSIYRTPPVGCAPCTPDFLNMAVAGKWKKSPEELLSVCKKLEVEFGRPSDHLPYSSRTLDIDILLFGDAIISNESLNIPHPEIKKRFFVLIPLVEIVPDWKYPGSEDILIDILDELKKTDPVEFCKIKKEEKK